MHVFNICLRSGKLISTPEDKGAPTGGLYPHASCTFTLLRCCLQAISGFIIQGSGEERVRVPAPIPKDMPNPEADKQFFQCSTGKPLRLQAKGSKIRHL